VIAFTPSTDSTASTRPALRGAGPSRRSPGSPQSLATEPRNRRLAAERPNIEKEIEATLAEASKVQAATDRYFKAFEAGKRHFFDDRFREARIAFERADPAARDARTRFYVAYSFYREGWGRFYHDDRLYEQGLAALQRATELAGGVVHADDDRLLLRTSDELRAELERGILRDASDVDPRRVFDRRK